MNSLSLSPCLMKLATGWFWSTPGGSPLYSVAECYCCWGHIRTQFESTNSLYMYLCQYIYILMQFFTGWMWLFWRRSWSTHSWYIPLGVSPTVRLPSSALQAGDAAWSLGYTGSGWWSWLGTALSCCQTSWHSPPRAETHMTLRGEGDIRWHGLNRGSSLSWFQYYTMYRQLPVVNQSTIFANNLLLNCVKKCFTTIKSIYILL